MLESRGTRKFGSNSSSIGSSTLSLDPLSGCLEGVDPLSQFSRESDPLSQMAAEYVRIESFLSSIPNFFIIFNSRSLQIIKS